MGGCTFCYRRSIKWNKLKVVVGRSVGCISLLFMGTVGVYMYVSVSVCVCVCDFKIAISRSVRRLSGCFVRIIRDHDKQQFAITHVNNAPRIGGLYRHCMQYFPRRTPSNNNKKRHLQILSSDFVLVWNKVTFNVYQDFRAIFGEY